MARVHSPVDFVVRPRAGIVSVGRNRFDRVVLQAVQACQAPVVQHRLLVLRRSLTDGGQKSFQLPEFGVLRVASCGELGKLLLSVHDSGNRDYPWPAGERVEKGVSFVGRGFGCESRVFVRIMEGQPHPKGSVAPGLQQLGASQVPLRPVCQLKWSCVVPDGENGSEWKRLSGCLDFPDLERRALVLEVLPAVFAESVQKFRR